MLLFQVVSVKWSHDLIYIKHLWIIKEVTFSAQFTTSGTRIEDGKLVILVGSFLCKYFCLLLLCCLLLFGRSLNYYRWKQANRKLAESRLKKILPNITSEPFLRCSILARMPHHDKKRVNPNIKKKLLQRLIKPTHVRRIQPGSPSLKCFQERNWRMHFEIVCWYFYYRGTILSYDRISTLKRVHF